MIASTNSASESMERIPMDDLHQIFRTINLDNRRSDASALEQFRSRNPLPLCTACVKKGNSPSGCTPQPGQYSFRCQSCANRKVECSWKGDIAAIVVLRRHPEADPVEVAEKYNKWIKTNRGSNSSKSVRKRVRSVKDKAGNFPVSSSKRRKTRTPSRSPSQTTISQAPHIIAFPAQAVEIQLISGLDDLTAFKYAFLEREKETMETSLKAAFCKIETLQEELKISQENVRTLQEKYLELQNENQSLKGQLSHVTPERSIPTNTLQVPSHLRGRDHVHNITSRLSVINVEA